MDFENNNTNQQEIADNVEEVTEETQYTGCDEELSQELTDEEYEQMLQDVPVAQEEKKKGFADFIAGLKNQAVCKVLFLFAAIGFIFPFFTEYEGETKVTLITGIETFKPFYMIGGSIEVGRSWMLIAAFALAVIGLVLTVVLDKEIRNIVGFICSTASVICMGVFAYMLPSIFKDALSNFLVQLSNMYSEMYGFAIDFTDEATRAQMGMDISSMKALPSTGFWFVAVILVVLVVYFICQIVFDSKKKAAVEMTFTEGEFPVDFDESVYDEDVADEIEAALEEAAEATEEEVTQEVTEETTEE